VIALGEQQFEDSAAVLLKPLGLGGDFHPFEDRRDTRRQEFVAALDFDKT
jgi:hypothetical protein